MISIFPTDQFLVPENETLGYRFGAEFSFFADELHSPVELLIPPSTTTAPFPVGYWIILKCFETTPASGWRSF